MKKITFLFIIVIVLLSGCKKTDLTASYIYITADAFSINVSRYNDEHNTAYDMDELASIASQNFSDAWVFVNGQDIGTWELPCKIPILGTDSTELMIFPGLKMNGSSTSRPRYPFVSPYKAKLNLTASEVTELTSLPLQYATTTSFEFVENFNTDYNGVFHNSDSTTVNFDHIADPNNPTNRIGCISLEGDIDEFEVISKDINFNNVLPNYVFLEMDYMCDVEDAEVYVTMLIDKSTTSVTTEEPLVVARAGSKWKKIYINLTQSVLRNQVYAINYRVQISGGRADETPVHFYFDNIKVIYQ